MPIIDLITPWAARPEGFAGHGHPELEAIRRQRTPTEPHLPAPAPQDALVRRARDASLHHLLRDTRDRLADRGLRAPARILLVATAAPGGTMEPLPGPGGDAVALFLDRAEDRELLRALAAAMAVLTRWHHPASPMAPLAARGDWDRWAAAREVPLVEWIYAAGLGVHARALLEPEVAPHALLALSRSRFRQLRHDERALAAQLDGDLHRTGTGGILRWLEEGTPSALRRAGDGTLVPDGAGRYLAWRELRDRVSRVGVVAACGMEAT